MRVMNFRIVAAIVKAVLDTAISIYDVFNDD